MNARPTAQILALPLALLCAGAPAAVLAQEPSPNVPVTERPRPELDPLGLRAGGFLIFPSLTVSETYDDNIRAEPDDEEDDSITLVQPRVRVQSNFPRHALGATAGADVAFFASESDENFEDVFASADGRLDITRQSNLSGSANIGRFHESRDDPEDVERDEPANFLRFGGDLAFRQAFNRLNFRLSGAVDRTDFEESADRDRDRVEYDAILRAGYFVSPRINTFVQGSFGLEDRDVDVDDEGFDRDSHGFGVAAGAEIDITALLFGEVFVGYRKQFFDEDAFEDEDGISFGLDLTWNPTLLTTLRFSGNGDFRPTSIDDASSNFRSQVGVRVDHELLRNLLIGGVVNYQRDDFDRIDRVDDTITAGADLTYLVNRYMSVGVEYRYADRSSDFDVEEFTRNSATLRLTGQL